MHMFSENSLTAADVATFYNDNAACYQVCSTCQDYLSMQVYNRSQQTPGPALSIHVEHAQDLQESDAPEEKKRHASLETQRETENIVCRKSKKLSNK